MKESQFQSLDHRLGAMKLHSRGEFLAAGFCPDLTATQDGALRLIIENEPRTGLKFVIASYQRAEKYCRDTRANPSLVIVTPQRGHTSVCMAADRLREFAQFWKGVNPPGAVREVLLLADQDYSGSVRCRIPVLSAQFRSLCQIVQLEQPASAPMASSLEPAMSPGHVDPEMLRPRGEAAALTT